MVDLNIPAKQYKQYFRCQGFDHKSSLVWNVSFDAEIHTHTAKLINRTNTEILLPLIVSIN